MNFSNGHDHGHLRSARPCVLVFTMTVALTGLAVFPVLLHLGTGLGVLLEWGSPLAQKDSLDYWLTTIIDLFRLAPATYDYQLASAAAYIQIFVALVVMATTTSTASSVRRIGYALLLFLYSVTQIRHVISGNGPEAIGFLFTHIFVFATQVLHYERTCSSSPLLKEKK